jgi:DsbC/DsbD-like thiol-disulfide interchange protein
MIRVLLFILAIVPVSVFAEPFPFPTSNIPSGPSVKLNIMIDRDWARSGDRFKLYISVQIEEGWHIYSLQPMDGNELLATQIMLKDNSFESQMHWQESPTGLIQDNAQEKLVKGHVKTAEFYNSFRVPKNIRPGNHSIKGKLLYKACNNRLCTLPQSIFFASQIYVGVAN